MHKLLLLQLIMIVGTMCADPTKDKCKVCTTMITKFVDTLQDNVKTILSKSDSLSTKMSTIEDAFKEFCKHTRGKENKICWWVGALETSATSILKELSRPLSNNYPPKRVCEILGEKDPQICEIKAEINIDNVDLKSQKVRDLKNILNNWGEECDGCLEKSDYIKRIEELKPKYSTKSKSEL